MTRRQFTGAGVTLSAAAASGGKIRAAVLGVGHAHAAGKVAALRALAEYELAGVCEPERKTTPDHPAYRGVRWLSKGEVLEDRSIELVAVESRVQENLGYARVCVDAGKHVHLDKPPGEDMNALRSLFAEAARRKLAVQMGYMWRYQPAMRAAIEAARKGWLGQVYAMRATIDKPISAEGRIELAAFRGGMMFELGCHLVDRAIDLFGRPKKVTGFLRHDGPFNDKLADNTLAILEFDRAIAEIYVAAHDPSGNRKRTLEILGANGSMAARPFSPVVLLTDLKQAAGPYQAGPREIRFPNGPLPAYGEDLVELARVIRHGVAPSYSSEHDLTTQETLLKACGYTI